MFLERETSTGGEYTSIDYEPFLKPDSGSEHTTMKEDEFIQSCLTDIFDPNTKDYQRMKLLDKIGGVSKILQMYGTNEVQGLEKHELEESKIKFGTNDSFMWNLLFCHRLHSIIVDKFKTFLPLILILMTLSVALKTIIYGFGVSSIIYGTLFIFCMGLWLTAGQLKNVGTWVFNELWYTGNKRMQDITFTVIRNGLVKRNLVKEELVCGDLLVISTHNPYVPED